jgi:hypothetical protein
MFHCYYDEILHIYLFFVICKNAQQMWNQGQMSEAAATAILVLPLSETSEYKNGIE